MTPPALMASSTTGAETTVAATSPNTTATIVLIVPAITTATVAPQRKAWIRAGIGSGSTRSSQSMTGSTMPIGTMPSATEMGLRMSRAIRPGMANSEATMTGTLIHSGSRRRSALPLTWTVQVLPSHHRHGARPQGSGSHPGGVGAGSSAGVSGEEMSVTQRSFVVRTRRFYGERPPPAGPCQVRGREG